MLSIYQALVSFSGLYLYLSILLRFLIFFQTAPLFSFVFQCFTSPQNSLRWNRLWCASSAIFFATSIEICVYI